MCVSDHGPNCPMLVVKDKKRLEHRMYINGLSVFKHNISSYAKGNYCLQGYWKLARMDRTFHPADNSRRDISGVKDILAQLYTISRNSYQEWTEYLRSSYINFDCYMTGRLCRF